MPGFSSQFVDTWGVVSIHLKIRGEGNVVGNKFCFPTDTVQIKTLYRIRNLNCPKEVAKTIRNTGSEMGPSTTEAFVDMYIYVLSDLFTDRTVQSSKNRPQNAERSASKIWQQGTANHRPHLIIIRWPSTVTSLSAPRDKVSCRQSCTWFGQASWMFIEWLFTLLLAPGPTTNNWHSSQPY